MKFLFHCLIFYYAKTRGRKVFSFSTAKGFLFQPLRAQRTQREKYFASFRLGVQKTLRSSRSLRLTNKNLRVFPSLRTKTLRPSRSLRLINKESSRLSVFAYKKTRLRVQKNITDGAPRPPGRHKRLSFPARRPRHRCRPARPPPGSQPSCHRCGKPGFRN